MEVNQGSDNNDKYAGFGRRILAYWVDFLILFPIGLTIQQMFGANPFAMFQYETLEQLQKAQQSGTNTVPTLISLAIGLAYFLIMWVNYDGATPGKRLMAIKIVKSDGSKMTYPAAFLRYIGYFVSAFVFCLGYLWMIWDKKKQAWHDKIAGTVVVKTDAQPKTFLALILAFIAILLISGYFGAAMYKGFQLGLKEVGKTGGPKVQQSINQVEKDVPTGNLHWDKSQELFQQLRAANEKEDIAKIKQLSAQIVEELKKVLEEQPNNARVWVELGHAYTWVSLLDPKLAAEEGLAAYKKAEELDPTNPIYVDYVADQLILMERYEEAVLQLQKSERLYPKGSGFTNLRLARAYKGLKIYDQSREHYQKAIELFTQQNTNGQYDDEILQARKEMTALPQ